MAVEKPDYRALIQPVTGLSESAQRDMVASYHPSEIYVCKTAEDFDTFLRQMRPPRVALVTHAGILAEQRGNKLDRVDNLAAMKAGIHRKGCYIEEVTGKRRSDKAWAAMKRDGEEMCRRLAQGRRSAINGRKGAEPYEFADKHLARFLLEMGRPGNDTKRLAKIAAYCKAQKIEKPGRTWLKTTLYVLARARGLTD
jgi:hypothetical protein